MNVTLDTNILLRHTIGDDAKQAAIAENIFQTSAEIIIPTHVLCEYVWTLRAGYKQTARAIAAAIRAIVATDRVVVDDDEVDAGLQMMDAGGDFADGVNAYAGTRMTSGKTVFVSFDQQAVQLLNSHGVPAVVPKQA
jgi:predicted nucleic-acid-binding protein